MAQKKSSKKKAAKKPVRKAQPAKKAAKKKAPTKRRPKVVGGGNGIVHGKKLPRGGARVKTSPKPSQKTARVTREASQQGETPLEMAEEEVEYTNVDRDVIPVEAPGRAAPAARKTASSVHERTRVPFVDRNASARRIGVSLGTK